MLFLLNDIVFELEHTCPAPARDYRRFSPLDLDSIIELGCELYAEDPLFHRHHPERARRLAWLISQKTEGVNAALFAAPEVGCAPELVEPRFCALPQPAIQQLFDRDRSGQLDAVSADKAVWGRLAA